MGSNLNFTNVGSEPPGNFSLARQHSVYSLTFDEFQSTVGEIGKDFGSMNMDELLKNIWNAEENQNIGSTSGDGAQVANGYLQRQGSLTLPRTLSQKTVDEVWRDVYGEGKDTNGSSVRGFCTQQTLGEVTLEEFLVRAGVVKEEIHQVSVKPKSVDFFGDFSRPVNNSGLEFGYHHHQQQAGGTAGLMDGRIAKNSNRIATQSTNLPSNVNGARSASQQLVQQVQPQQQKQFLPEQPTLAYGAPMGIQSNGQLSSSGIRSRIIGISDPVMSSSMVQNVPLQGRGVGMIGLGANGVTVATGSPAVSSDGFAKSNVDTSSVSPVPYLFNGGLRGRKGAALEKVVERRQRRMIKNRESAARSRARKQAYTTELEEEIAKLKEENEELEKKQAEMMEKQTGLGDDDSTKQQNENKKQCLRRTHTGPW